MSTTDRSGNGVGVAVGDGDAGAVGGGVGGAVAAGTDVADSLGVAVGCARVAIAAGVAEGTATTAAGGGEGAGVLLLLEQAAASITARTISASRVASLMVFLTVVLVAFMEAVYHEGRLLVSEMIPQRDQLVADFLVSGQASIEE